MPRDGCPDESPARSPLSRLLQVHPLGHARVLRAPRMLPSRLSHSDASRARARQFAYTRATCEQAARPVPDSWAAHLEHPCPSQRSPVGESMTPSSSLPPNPICAICSKPIRSGFIYTKGSDAIHIDAIGEQQLHLPNPTAPLGRARPEGPCPPRHRADHRSGGGDSASALRATHRTHPAPRTLPCV